MSFNKAILEYFFCFIFLLLFINEMATYTIFRRGLRLLEGCQTGNLTRVGAVQIHELHVQTPQPYPLDHRRPRITGNRRGKFKVCVINESLEANWTGKVSILYQRIPLSGHAKQVFGKGLLELRAMVLFRDVSGRS